MTHAASYAILTTAPSSRDRSGEWITEYLGVPFPHGATSTGQVVVYWNGAEINNNVPISAANENWYIPGRTATALRNSISAVTVLNPR